MTDKKSNAVGSWMLGENTASNLNQIGKIADYAGYIGKGITSAVQHSLNPDPALEILRQQIENKIYKKYSDPDMFKGTGIDNFSFQGVTFPLKEEDYVKPTFSENKLQSEDKDFLMSMISKKVKDKQFKKLKDGSLQISIDYTSYGKNSDGANIAALLGTPIGTDGVTSEDRQMIKMLYGTDKEGTEGLIDSSLKLGRSVLNDPVTSMALTLGGFIATVSPDGNVKITDKYDAERFAKGSGSPAKGYRWLRNTLQDLNLFAIEGEGDQAIKVDIDLGNINTKGKNR
tara:strand:+ start:435 stop:1292 length:858 start_codon:yes stop_codon:yes gene_type:complete